MKNLLKIAALFLGILLAVLAVSAFPTVKTVRYRLSLFVDTPEGVRSGSGVVLVRSEFRGPGIGNAVENQTTGEAVVVDLGSRGVLFALLSGDPLRYAHGEGSQPEPIYLLSHTFRSMVGNGGPEFQDALNRAKPHVDLSFDSLPMLVRFRNTPDPKTVERVDPDDLAASFGSGVSMKRATIEITDDPVTTGIDRYLGWWFAQAKKPFDPPAFRYPDNSPRGYNTVNVTEFIQPFDWRWSK